MSKKLSFLTYGISTILIIIFSAIFISYKTATLWYSWAIITTKDLLFFILPPTFIVLSILTIILWMVFYKIFSWWTISWIISSLILLTILEVISLIFIQFETKLQYLFISFILIIYVIHSSLFIYFNNKATK